MANPTFQLIASNTVGSGGAASVTFSSIPQTYTDLVLKVSARSSYASTGQPSFYLNLISGTTPTEKSLYGNGATAASNSTYGSVWINKSTDTSNTFGNLEVYIPNYTGSTNKSYSIDGVEETNATTAYSSLVAGLSSNTAAVTTITITTDNNFLQYSTFYLYGIKNS